MGKLNDKEYNAEESKQWTLELCNEIKQSVKELNIPRYKVIVQVVIGENSGQGIRVASKCLWDTSSDNWASFSYKNRRFSRWRWSSGAPTSEAKKHRNRHGLP